MAIRNNLKKSFGPSVSAAGVIIFIAGIFSSFYSFLGFFLICGGALLAFTNTVTFIDYEKKRIKNADCIFGFICLGKWIDVSTAMKLSIEKYKTGFTTLSQSNKSADVYLSDYRIILHVSEGKNVPIMKCKTIESAQTELNNIDKQLHGTSNSTVE